MDPSLNNMLDSIVMGFSSFQPELGLSIGMMILILSGMIWKNKDAVHHSLALIVLLIVLTLECLHLRDAPMLLFGGIFKTGNSFADFFKILFSIAGIFTVAMTWRSSRRQIHLSEYYALILAVILGANLLVMSENLLVLFLSMELISIGSYVLTGFAFNKKSTEGSLKYFLFGSIASAVMLYGFTILYGIFGSFYYPDFQLPSSDAIPLFFIGGVFSLAGFLYKITAAPLHPWAPDVYEAAPMPMVSFFSVVPKLAGIGILLKFVRYTNLLAETNWNLILTGVAILTLTVGNFSALWQKNVKRLMAYSSIGQSGFLLIGVLSGSLQGAQFLLFYSTVYLITTFSVFFYLQYFENAGLTTIADYKGMGKVLVLPSVLMLAGFVSLTGLPPTSGFTGKLFLFSALWESYAVSDDSILLVLMVFGLLNTVVSLFYYLRIPYFAFISTGEPSLSRNNLAFENLLTLILVLVILILFFSPQLLMGWINKSNFVF